MKSILIWISVLAVSVVLGMATDAGAGVVSVPGDAFPLPLFGGFLGGLFKAIGSGVKSVGKLVGKVAPYAAVIPGVGPLVAGAASVAGGILGGSGAQQAQTVQYTNQQGQPMVAQYGPAPVYGSAFGGSQVMGLLKQYGPMLGIGVAVFFLMRLRKKR